MKSTLHGRLGRIIKALPDVYTIQPSTDYQRLISHSSTELNAKAWGRTAAQMRRAIEHFNERRPDVREQLEQQAS